MGVCILGMGDCGNKSSSSFTTNVSKISQTMSNMVTSTSNSTYVKNYNVQNNAVNVTAPPGYDRSWGPLMKGCTMSNNQTMNATQSVSVSLDVSSTKNLQTQITNSLKAANDTSTKQKSAFLQTASNSSSSATTVNEAISNLVSTNISDSVTNSLQVLLDNAQNNIVNVVGPVECTKDNPNFTVNIQNMLVSQIVNTITKALTGTTLSNIQKSTTDATNKVTADQEGEGVTSIIDSLFDGIGGVISGPFKYIGIAIVAVVLLGIIGKVVMSKKSESAFGRRRRR